MTPQEMFEYKNNWKPGYRVQVDCDSDVWGKDYCRKHLERHEWTFDKHTRPDDSHTFAFEQKEVAQSFYQAYNEYNPKFTTFDGEELQRMKGVTRFEVIDDTGRAYVKYLHKDQGEKIKYCLQDDDRTLKVFIDKRDSI